MTVGRIPVIEGGIQPTIFDAKADLLTATANDTPARLAVGTDYGFLQADSTQSTGLLWNNAAWTSYTPTVTPLTGTFTSTVVNFGRYIRVGKICIAQFSAGIGVKGTGAGVYISLPFSYKNNSYDTCIGTARETSATGNLLQCRADHNVFDKTQLGTYNNSDPANSGYIYGGTVVYEVA